jgi:hypothetical protein
MHSKEQSVEFRIVEFGMIEKGFEEIELTTMFTTTY